MFGIQKMTRWVEVEGRKVRFGNIVGGFVGRDYVFECKTPRNASEFGRYLEKSDPKNPNLPVAVTAEIEKQFNAREIK